MLVEQQHLRLVYVSGRSQQLILSAIKEYELPPPAIAITDVGTRIYHIEQSISKDQPASVWKLDHDWERYLGHNWHTENISRLRQKLDQHDGLKLQEAEKQTEFKLSYYLDMRYYNSDIKSEIEQICKDLSLDCNIIKSHDETTDTGLLDILPGNASKYHAIRFLMDKYSITEKEIVFCGDSGNDMEVLVSEIPAVLVNNAQQSVKHQAQQLSAAKQHTTQLYIASGEFYGLNGNYCSGILEGLAYYYQEFERLIGMYLTKNT
jgi:hypothetical protein